MKLPRLGIARATVISAAADGTVALATLFTTPILVTRLGTEPYGIIVLVSVLAGQLALLQMGLGPAITRRVAEKRGSDQDSNTSVTFAAALALALVVGLLMPMALLAASRVAWGHLFQSSPATKDVALAAMPAAATLVAIGPLIVIGHGFLMGVERFEIVVVFRLVHGLLRVGIAVGVTLLGGGVSSVLWGQAVADGIVAILAVTVPSPYFSGRISWTGFVSELRTILALGAPFAVVAALHPVLMDSEKIAIAMTESVKNLTYYAVPSNVVARATLFTGILWNLLIPRMARMATSAPEAIAALARQATRVVVALMVAPLALGIALTPELLELWLGLDFAHQARASTRILLVVALVTASIQPASAVLWAKMRPTRLVVVQLIEIPLHFATVFVLVQAWGVIGAAAACGVRAAIDGGINRYLAKRILGSPAAHPYDIWLPIVSLAMLTLVFETFGPSLGPVWRSMVAISVTAVVLRRLPHEDWHALRHVFPKPAQA